ncbi:MAG: universal stress protein [Acidobacteria bacterium]|nr:universal stress protein [Acidobacteriota bacterium]
MSFERIVVATDFSEGSAAVMGMAETLAGPGSATVFLVHVLEFPMAAAVTGTTQSESEESYRKAVQQMDQFISKQRPPEIEIRKVVLVGTPAEAISEFARQEQAQMIVVGTRGRSGLARVLLGSTAESVLRQAPCHVLVVKSVPRQ